MDDLYPYNEPVKDLKDRIAFDIDMARFAGRHVKALEGVTILSVGGRDGRLDNDFVLDTRLANGQRMQMVLDQHRYMESEAAIRLLQGHTNVYRDDRNTPVEARFEGAYTQVKHRNTKQPEWVFRVAQATFRDRDGVEHAIGRPIHRHAMGIATQTVPAAPGRPGTSAANKGADGPDSTAPFKPARQTGRAALEL